MCKYRIIGIEFDTEGEQDEYSQDLLLGGKTITFEIPEEMLQQALDGFDESDNAEEETP